MRYRPELDGLRALAVLAVIASHSNAPFTGGGWMGVDVFFVLSGYLITSLLLAERDRSGRIALGKFYSRRALRLYPALLLMLLLSLPFFVLLGDGGTLAGYGRTALDAGLYIQDFVSGLTGDAHGGLGHTWSLAVEEQFYLLWPIVLILLLRFHAKLLTWTVAGAVISFAILGVLSFQLSSDGIPDAAYYLPWSRFSTLFVGCCLAIVLHRGHRPRIVQRTWFGAVAGIAVVGLFVAAAEFGRYPNLVWEAPAIALATAAVVWHLSSVSSPFSPLLGWKPLAWLGRRSYGMYLYHVPIFLVLIAVLPVRRSLLTLIVVLITIGVATLSYQFVELPFLRLKKRFSVVKTAPVEPTLATAAPELGGPARGHVTP